MKGTRQALHCEKRPGTHPVQGVLNQSEVPCGCKALHWGSPGPGGDCRLTGIYSGALRHLLGVRAELDEETRKRGNEGERGRP